MAGGGGVDARSPPPRMHRRKTAPGLYTGGGEDAARCPATADHNRTGDGGGAAGEGAAVASFALLERRVIDGRPGTVNYRGGKKSENGTVVIRFWGEGGGSCLKIC